MGDSSKLKLLVVTPCYYPAIVYGGPVNAVHEMNKALVKSGIAVTVFTTNANGPVDLDVALEQETDVDGVKVVYYERSLIKSYFYSPKLSKSLKINVKSFDVVHINWMYVYTSKVAATECIRQCVPYIITPHGMLDSYSISLKGTLKKKLYIFFIERRNILNARYIHYASLGEKQESLASGWNINEVVIPNIIALPDQVLNPVIGENMYKKYPELIDKCIVLFVGRLNYIKGLDQLLKGWKRVVASIPNAHLIVAGPDADGYMPTLIRLVDENVIHNSVTFTGTVIGDEKAELFRISEVFVSSSYLESFGMAIAEAMAYGLPVSITDRVNIKTEINSSHAGLISSCDPVSISNNLIYLLENKYEAKQMGLRGKILVAEKFEMSVVVKKMEELYLRIANDNVLV